MYRLLCCITSANQSFIQKYTFLKFKKHILTEKLENRNILDAML